jgi:hypothetical protein
MTWAYARFLDAVSGEFCSDASDLLPDGEFMRRIPSVVMSETRQINGKTADKRRTTRGYYQAVGRLSRRRFCADSPESVQAMTHSPVAKNRGIVDRKPIQFVRNVQNGATPIRKSIFFPRRRIC